MSCKIELKKNLKLKKVGTKEYEVTNDNGLIGYVHGFDGKWESFDIHSNLVHPIHTELNRWHAANYLLASI